MTENLMIILQDVPAKYWEISTALNREFCQSLIYRPRISPFLGTCAVFCHPYIEQVLDQVVLRGRS